MENANILDYIKWRGDLSFLQDGFNDVDSLILTQIAYIPFERIVPSIRSVKDISIREASNIFFKDKDIDEISLGALIPHGIYEVFKACGESNRFGKMKLCRYVNKISEDKEIQFCAITVVDEESQLVYLSYRGTDDTIVGWKENFNMSYMTPVPAQIEALKYFNYVTAQFIKFKGINTFMLGGHSKGGNLAVYAAAFGEKFQGAEVTISRIYNFDGPGFDEKVTGSKEYMGIREDILSFVPQASIVGMLLGHEDSYTVVKSDKVGLMQHDALTWAVMGREFVCLDTITQSSQLFDKSMKEWVAGLSPEKSQAFVNAMFEILTCTDASTLTDLVNGGNKTIAAIFKAYADEDDDTKKMIHEILRSMMSVIKENLKKNNH